MAYRPRPVIGIKLNGWNQAAARCIDAPTWTWEPVAAASYYEVRLVGANDQTARAIRIDEAAFDMSPVWGDLPLGDVDMLILGFDADGTEICHSAYKSEEGPQFEPAPTIILRGHGVRCVAYAPWPSATTARFASRENAIRSASNDSRRCY